MCILLRNQPRRIVGPRGRAVVARCLAVICVGLAFAACSNAPGAATVAQPPAEPVADADGVGMTPESRGDNRATRSAPSEVFPHVQVDLEEPAVLIDATPIFDLSGADASEVWLEVIVCTPDTREHEAVLVTSAKAAHVHAALLLLGLEPGAPGGWERIDGGASHRRIPPTGPAVDVDFILDRDGETVAEPAASWVVNALANETMGPGRFVFAGSRIVQVRDEARYDADWEGTLVGLATFGAETIGWSDVISPDSAVDEPVWIINADRYPPSGTSVTVRIRPAQGDNDAGSAEGANAAD